MPRFRHKPTIVDAVRLNEDQELEIKVQGEDVFIPARAGDWTVTGDDGETYRIKHARFMYLYEPDDDIAVKYLQSKMR